MRLVKYVADGRPHIGVRIDEERVAPAPWNDFEELFAQDDPLAAVLAFDPSTVDAIRPERLLAPTVNRPYVIGTGGNYPDHVAEAKAEIDTREPVFLPFLWGAIIGPDDDIVVPAEDTLTDYEVEFSVVIGKVAKGLTRDNAMDYVFGYTIVNDVSAREVMARERMQAMLSKSVDTFLPVGPHIVTKDEIADPYSLAISTYLNGEVRQKAVTGSMMHRIPQLLETLTRTITLHPGDIVTTGTPGGVGYFRDPPEFLHPGDTIVAQVEQVGRLENKVQAGWLA
jgi:2-keto-4-pentenoate hydratase/2-oxohepta-3-ene-1,7-dioic acid hydratase in catechol pathway